MSGDERLTAEIVAIEKVSAVAYLQAVFSCWRERAVAMPVEQPLTASLPGQVIGRRVSVAPGGGWFEETLAPDDDPAPAQISFTSGTTGDPKPILLSRRALSDVTARLVEVMEMDCTIREYVGVPVTFSFGLGRARAVAAVGGRSYLPERGFRVDELAEMLANGEVNALSAVPTLLRVLIQQQDALHGIGQRLRWLEIGSQLMSAEEKAAVRAIFPNARIVQHYGLTEASRTTFLAVDEADGAALDSVGRPTGAAEVRIDPDGRICIRGAHVADGVLGPDGLTPLTDADGWLRTNDLGTIDERGFVHFAGRADHVINVGGIKVSAELFEQRLAERLGAEAGHVAVAGRPDPLRGEAVLVAHLPGVARDRLGEQARAVAAGFGLGAADVGLAEVAEIPRTDTGKVRRGELTARHGSSIAPVAAGPDLVIARGDEPHEGREREIAAIWHEALGVWPIGRHENFFDLGGDSLSAITVMLRMERAGIPKSVTQQIFEGRTIAEIAAEAEAGDGGQAREPALRSVTSDAINFTRGILVLMVVGAHWTPFLLERMGTLGAAIHAWTWPLFRIGTPGFAMVFGMGLGYFLLPVAKSQPERLSSRLRTSLLIVGSGVGLTALFIGAEVLLTDGTLGPRWATRLFYGVLTFYLLMVATARPLLRLIGAARYPMLAALLLMVAGLALTEWASPLLQRNAGGLADLGHQLLAANYGYPRMLAYVMLGLAMGVWIEGHNDRPDLARVTVWAGSVMFAGGIVLSFGTGLEARWFVGIPTQPAIITYAGAILLIFATAFHLAHRCGAREWRAFRILAVIGILAFLAYVGHGAVQPLKGSLVALGMSEMLGRGVALSLFLLLFGLAMRRVYRLYYG